jgi:hypothetical protein
MVKPEPYPPASSPPRQLPLPLLPAPGPAPPWLPRELATLPAHRIWATLAPAARAQTREIVLRVIQEVLDDRHRP